jgi:hypothetical protein
MTERFQRLLSTFKQHKEILFTLAAWLFSVALLSPTDEFPLNDDWVYLQVLKNLYDTHHLIFTDWISSTLFSHVMWGFCFCLAFGYKIAVARLSTLTATFLIGIIFYRLSYKLTKHQLFSALASATFLFNPVLYVQSFTFMTESTFNLGMLLCLSSTYYFLLHQKISRLAAATFWGCIAVLVKQPGLLVAGCLPLIFITGRKINPRLFVPAFISLLTVLLTYKVYMHWLNGHFANPEHVNGVTDNLLHHLKDGFRNFYAAQITTVGIVFMYAGFFMLPMTPLILSSNKKLFTANLHALQAEFRFSFLNDQNIIRSRINAVYHILLIVFAVFSILFAARLPIPSIENIFYNFGLGPVLLYDTFILKINISGQEISSLFFKVLSFAGLFTSLWLFFNILLFFLLTIKRARKGTETRHELFFRLLFYCAISYTVLLANVYIFDRYILFLVPLLLMMFAIAGNHFIHSISRRYYMMSIALIVLTALFDVTATHDYFSWNRAKWSLLTDLTDHQKISPGEIDGGYEFNGIHNYDVNYIRSKDKSWWWVNDNKYIITMGPLAGYEKYSGTVYKKWMPQGKDSLFVLRRIPPRVEIRTVKETASYSLQAAVTSPEK